MPDDDWTKSPYYSIDPFADEVAPSLLNSADILRYADLGCLVHPFNPDPELLNPATYTLKFLGTLYSWEQEGDTLCPSRTPIIENDPVRLKANSISYLETEEVFRLPQYIAARFNLHIRHVHRGILLGTGPIVDPGFVGPLLVPLHNLTSNNYDVIGGDKLLWVEFTKLTSHKYWVRSEEKLDDRPPNGLVAFPPEKRNLAAHQYFAKAGIGIPGVVSAFKGELASSRRNAQAASEAAEDASTTVKRLTAVGGLGIAVAIGALIFSAYELFQNNSEMASSVHDRLDRIERQTGLLPSISGLPSPTVAGTADDCRETDAAEQPSNQGAGTDPSSGPEADSQAERRTGPAEPMPSAQ